MTPAPCKLTNIDALAGLMPAFEFDRLIAQGGMGAVYKARQRSLDREVAIKILPRESGDDPLFRSSFQAEAIAMARLNHPNLIKVFDSGDLDGLLYIVMEYVPGKSLFHAAHGIAINSKQAVEIVIGVCRGLTHAHENGIVHRDIKPGNILLTLQCEPKIGDFGLARCTRTNLDGLAMGTPAYMAPELLSQPEKGDPCSDVHAIGVVLRELLTGVPAETGFGSKAMVSDLTLAAICRKATHPDPALRYPDASSLAEQLTRWMTPQTSSALVTAMRPVTYRPTPASFRPAPASFRPAPANIRPVPARPARQVRTGHRALLKTCAIIAFLVGAIHLTRGLYQRGHGEIARQTREPSENARSQATGRSTSSRDPDTAPPEAINESSLHFLVRLGSDLAPWQNSTAEVGGIPAN